MLLGSKSIKAVCKTLMKLTPGKQQTKMKFCGSDQAFWVPLDYVNQQFPTHLCSGTQTEK